MKLFSFQYRGSWSDHGCKTVAANSTGTWCECYHLTNFAVIVSTYRPVSIPFQTLICRLAFFGEFWSVKFIETRVFFNLFVSIFGNCPMGDFKKIETSKVKVDGSLLSPRFIETKH